MKSMKSQFIIPSVLILIILFSFFTFYLINSERNKNEELLNKKVEKITTFLSLTSSSLLWDFDKATLITNASAFLKDEELIKIIIKDTKGRTYVNISKHEGEHKGKHDKTITNHLNIMHDEQKIGIIATEFTTYYIEQNLKQIRNKLLILFVLSCLIIGIIILIISNKVTQPISRLAYNINHLDLEHIHNITNGIERTDISEVDSLLSSYQNMATELSSTFEELKAQNDELEASYAQSEKVTNNLQEIIKISSSLTDSIFYEDNNQFFSELLSIAHKLTPGADYGSIYLIEDEHVKFIDTIGHDLELLQSIPIKKEYMNNSDDTKIIKNIIEPDNNIMPKEISKIFNKAIKATKSTLLVKLNVLDEWKGTITLDIAKDNNKQFGKEAIQTIKAFGNIASAFLTMQSYKNIQDRFQKELIISVIKILELHDCYTKGHSEGVAKISARIAQELKLSNYQVKQAYWSGMVHDIGKILIDNDILNKPSKLTDEEYNQIKKHPIWGYEVLTTSKSKELRSMAKYIRHHHERWDGYGYPDKLSKNEIPLISQILAVADTWNTMRTDRSYRKKLPKETALQELIDNKRTQFCPAIVDIALNILEEEF